jgi:hypothetical protein
LQRRPANSETVNAASAAWAPASRWSAERALPHAVDPGCQADLTAASRPSNICCLVFHKRSHQVNKIDIIFELLYLNATM